MTRQRLRNHYANESWSHFNTLLERTPRGNFGYLGLYYDDQEILPWIQGDYRFDKNDTPVDRFPSREIEIKALVEGQFIAKRAHAEQLGYIIGLLHHKVLVTVMQPNTFTRFFQFNRRQYKDRGHWRRFNQQHYTTNIIRCFQCTRLHASKHEFIV